MHSRNVARSLENKTVERTSKKPKVQLPVPSEHICCYSTYLPRVETLEMLRERTEKTRPRLGVNHMKRFVGGFAVRFCLFVTSLCIALAVLKLTM